MITPASALAMRERICAEVFVRTRIEAAASLTVTPLPAEVPKLALAAAVSSF
jgi:hypothetical protein